MPIQPSFASWLRKKPTIKEGWRQFSGDAGNQAGLRQLGNLMLQGAAADDPWGGVLQGLAQFAEVSKAERERLKKEAQLEEDRRRRQQLEDLQAQGERQRIRTADDAFADKAREEKRLEDLRNQARQIATSPTVSEEDRALALMLAESPGDLAKWTEGRRDDRVKNEQWKAEFDAAERQRQAARQVDQQQLAIAKERLNREPKRDIRKTTVGGKVVTWDADSGLVLGEEALPVSLEDKVRMAASFLRDGPAADEASALAMVDRMVSSFSSTMPQGIQPLRMNEQEALAAIQREVDKAEAVDPAGADRLVDLIEQQ
ncbi:MAG: hypothetical protein ACRCVZ_13000, partial [Aestuariivirga sp.]